MQQKNSNFTNSQKKKIWFTPTLHVYGSVRELTKGTVCKEGGGDDDQGRVQNPLSQCNG